ncbi:MAG: Na+/H+ antiporter NhaA, partial [Campylobacteraceae bacterium]
MEAVGQAKKQSTKKVANFIGEIVNKESFSGIILFIAAVLAMFYANKSITSSTYFDIWHLELGISI